MALTFASASLWAQDPQVNFTVRGRWPGFERGSAMGVAVVGQYAYVTVDDAEVLILDISTPAAPVWRGSVNVGASPSGITAAGNRLFVAHGKELPSWMPWPGGGLVVLDASEPLNPVRVGALETGYNTKYYPQVVQVSGDYVYLLCGDWSFSGGGLEVIDVHNPAQPARTGRLEIPAQMWNLQVSGNHAYVGSGDGLWVLDVSNPLEPAVVVRYEPTRWFPGVAVSGHYAYVAMMHVGFVALDVSDPANPTPVGTFLADVPTSWQRIHLAGPYAYWETDQGLDVMDISDPTRLRRVGRCVGQVSGAFQVLGDHGYGVGGEGLQVINLADPVNPIVVGGFATGGSSSMVQVVGNRAYLAEGGGGGRILDVSDPGHPVAVGTLKASAGTLRVSGSYAYVAGPASFDVFDISNPIAPTHIGEMNPNWQGSFQIRVVGDCACVAGWGIEEYLMLVDVSNRAQPVQLPGLLLNGSCFISATGQYLYVGTEYSGPLEDTNERFYILDVSDPASPRVVGKALTQGQAGSPDVIGNYAYLPVGIGHPDRDTLNGLEVFDISNPAAPVSVGAGEGVPRATLYLEVEGQYAYYSGQKGVGADAETWLQVMDVKDPLRPKPVGGCRLINGSYGGWGRDMFQVVGNLIYVADGTWGLTILEVELPDTLKLKPPVLTGSTLTLSWNGGPGIKLQRTASLTPPSWQDVPASDGASQIELPRNEPTGFFRLVKP